MITNRVIICETIHIYQIIFAVIYKFLCIISKAYIKQKFFVFDVTKNQEIKAHTFLKNFENFSQKIKQSLQHIKFMKYF